MPMTARKAIASLWADGRVDDKWLPGMRLDGGARVCAVVEHPNRMCMIDELARFYVAFTDPLGELVLDDAATIGCLEALCIEASKDPGLYIERTVTPYNGRVWYHVRNEDRDLGLQVESRGAAWAAYLVMLATSPA